MASEITASKKTPTFEVKSGSTTEPGRAAPAAAGAKGPNVVDTGLRVGGAEAIVPVVGTALGVVSVPLVGGAFTHATWKVFVMHFEAGGTILDFDPHKMRNHFKREFEMAKQAVAYIRKEEQAKTTKPS